MNNCSIIIPNRFEDIIQPLLESLKEFGCSFHILIISDSHDRGYGYDYVRTDYDKFIFSRSVNVGINHVAPNDVILLNDDTRLIHRLTFETLREAAYSDISIGIAAPVVDGGTNNKFAKLSNSHLWVKFPSGIRYCSAKSNDRISFTCVYLKRKMLDEIGLLDENYSGYGYEDADMCVRAIMHGWKLALTNKVSIMHGLGGSKLVVGHNWHSSYRRTGKVEPRVAMKYFLSKNKEAVDLINRGRTKVG